MDTVTQHATRHTPHASRLTPHASRYTLHATRHTPHISHHVPHASRLTLHASRYTLQVPISCFIKYTFYNELLLSTIGPIVVVIVCLGQIKRLYILTNHHIY